METKLEAIKHAWENQKKSGDLTMFSLNYATQIDWLIEKAEELERIHKSIEVKGITAKCICNKDLEWLLTIGEEYIVQSLSLDKIVIKHPTYGIYGIKRRRFQINLIQNL